MHIVNGRSNVMEALPLALRDFAAHDLYWFCHFRYANNYIDLVIHALREMA